MRELVHVTVCRHTPASIIVYVCAQSLASGLLVTDQASHRSRSGEAVLLLMMCLSCLIDVKCGLEYGSARVYVDMPINFKKPQLQTISLSAIKQVRLATLNCSHLLGQVRSVSGHVACHVLCG